MAIWKLLQLSGRFYGHLVVFEISVYFKNFWYIYQEKSGNPDRLRLPRMEFQVI
jgi:hypothetical protein